MHRTIVGIARAATNYRRRGVPQPRAPSCRVWQPVCALLADVHSLQVPRIQADRVVASITALAEAMRTQADPPTTRLLGRIRTREHEGVIDGDFTAP